MHKNKETYRRIFKLDSKPSLNEEEKSMLLKTILSSKKKESKRKLYRITAIAASLVLTSFLLFHHFKSQTEALSIIEVAELHKKAIKENNKIQLITLDPKLGRKEVNEIQEYTDSLMTLDQIIEPNNPQNTFVTIYVPYGKRQEFRLPDNSTVWLNAGSYLTYKNQMQIGSREVYLNGEGYFDVVHNGNSFTVRTSETSIQVLGTSFNVNSYESDDKTAVELLTGSISLTSMSGSFESILMKPGERINFDHKNRKLTINKQASGADILWTKKQLQLDQLSFPELIRNLERVYNVQIHADKHLLALQTDYSGRLNIDVDIKTSLQSIYELRDYEIIQKEKEVWIRKK